MYRQSINFKKLRPLAETLLKPRHLALNTFKQKVNIYIERERFIIKTAENEDDLANVLRLRYDVFYRELLEKRLLTGIDIDKFDFLCDHLIIIDKKSDSYIGTYRLLSSLFSDKFYSATEFDLSNILSLPGVKLELGRACVHKDYRTGSTITLLWRGISKYMRETGTKYLFGCSSVKNEDKTEITRIYRHLKANSFTGEEFRVCPRWKFRIKRLPVIMKRLDQNMPLENDSEVTDLIPPLLKSYINMGAQVCGEPAYDRKFKCADFLTLFNIDNSSSQTKRKYSL
ncbi:putative hemolysin [Chitinispirillum alkaliphilum]|nr:putative hemolysin [Chitinispirillum alkaliphilum]